MAQSTERLRCNMLDLLIDGPSSFAALYAATTKYLDSSEPIGVEAVLDLLFDMDRRKLIHAQKVLDSGKFHSLTEHDRAEAKRAYQAWLPEALGTDLSVDNVGVWFKIGEEGRKEWHRCLEQEKHDPEGHWALDDSGFSQTIMVQAENANMAEEALLRWLLANPSIELVKKSKIVEPVSEFKLQNGEIVTGGVRLVVSYRRKSSPTQKASH